MRKSILYVADKKDILKSSLPFHRTEAVRNPFPFCNAQVQGCVITPSHAGRMYPHRRRTCYPYARLRIPKLLSLYCYSKSIMKKCPFSVGRGVYRAASLLERHSRQIPRPSIMNYNAPKHPHKGISSNVLLLPTTNNMGFQPTVKSSLTENPSLVNSKHEQ